jgi:hypothetical protein
MWLRLWQQQLDHWGEAEQICCTLAIATRLASLGPRRGLRLAGPLYSRDEWLRPRARGPACHVDETINSKRLAPQIVDLCPAQSLTEFVPL